MGGVDGDLNRPHDNGLEARTLHGTVGLGRGRGLPAPGLSNQRGSKVRLGGSEGRGRTGRGAAADPGPDGAAAARGMGEDEGANGSILGLPTFISSR